MKVKVWGCRGSIPTPGASTVRYGGNTSCYEVRNDANELLILDAGSGVRELGLSLLSQMPLDVPILVTHTHWDHIMGYPFFVPLFIPGNKFQLYGPAHFDRSFESVMTKSMDYTFFPIRMEELTAELKFNDLKEGSHQINNFDVNVKYMNHPILCLGYRIVADGKTLVYTGDTEPYYNTVYHGREPADEDEQDEKEELDEFAETQNQIGCAFLNQADLVIHDCMYTAEEYPTKIGWGHSSMEYAIDQCIIAGAKKLVMTHHEPVRNDDQFDALLPALQERAGDKLEVCFAREGEEIII